MHPNLRNWRIRLLPDEQGRRLYMRQRTSPAVVMFIPVFAISDHNDQSAYSLLVAHVPWQLEAELVEGYDSPTAALQAKMHLFPESVKQHFEHRRRFETVLVETVGYASNFQLESEQNTPNPTFSYFHGEEGERIHTDDDIEGVNCVDFADFVSILDPDNRYVAENPLHQAPNHASADASNELGTASMSLVKVLKNNCTKKLVHQFTSKLNKDFLELRSASQRSRQPRNRFQTTSSSSTDAYCDDAFDWRGVSRSVNTFCLNHRDNAIISLGG